MSGRILRFSVALVFLLVFSVAAYADITGTWEITGTAKQKVSIRGHSSLEQATVTDQFVFGEDWVFSMTDLPPEANARWGYVKKKFAVYLDDSYLISSITDIMIDGLESEGYTVEISNPTITKNAFIGKEMKDGTIKGKWTLIYSAYLYLVDYGRGFNMKYKSTIKFTGVQAAGPGILGLGPNESDELAGDSIQGIITEAVRDRIREALTEIDPVR